MATATPTETTSVTSTALVVNNNTNNTNNNNASPKNTNTMISTGAGSSLITSLISSTRNTNYDLAPIDLGLVPMELQCVPSLNDEDIVRVQMAAVDGNPLASWRCGTTHDISREPPATTCIPWLVKAVEVGSILACGELGILKITGQHGVEVDVATGNALLARAYDGGCVHSQLMAGVMAWANGRYHEARYRWQLILGEFGQGMMSPDRIAAHLKIPREPRTLYGWQNDIIDWMCEAARRSARLARYLLSTLYISSTLGPASSPEAAYDALQRYGAARFDDAVLRVTTKSDLATITPTLIDVAAAGLVCGTYGKPHEKRLRLELHNLRVASNNEISRLRERHNQEKNNHSLLLRTREELTMVHDDAKRQRLQFEKHVFTLTNALESMQQSQTTLIGEVKHWKKKAEDAVAAAAAMARYVSAGQGSGMSPHSAGSTVAVDNAQAHMAHAAAAMMVAQQAVNANTITSGTTTATGHSGHHNHNGHTHHNNHGSGVVAVDESGDSEEDPDGVIITSSTMSSTVPSSNNHTTTNNNNSGGLRAQKPYGACLACYTMKMRCDGMRPCERCRHNGRAALCIDRTRKKPLSRRSNVNAVLAAAMATTSPPPPSSSSSSQSSSVTSIPVPAHLPHLAIAIPPIVVAGATPAIASPVPTIASSSSFALASPFLATEHQRPYIATAVTATPVPHSRSSTRRSPDRGSNKEINTINNITNNSGTSSANTTGTRRIAQGAACSICYSHKTKCDGERPCERCWRMNRADQCRDRVTSSTVGKDKDKEKDTNHTSTNNNGTPPPPVVSSVASTLPLDTALMNAVMRRRSRSKSPIPRVKIEPQSSRILQQQPQQPPHKQARLSAPSSGSTSVISTINQALPVPTIPRVVPLSSSTTTTASPIDDDDDSVSTPPPLISPSSAAVVAASRTVPLSSSLSSVTSTPTVAPSSYSLAVLAAAARFPSSSPSQSLVASTNVPTSSLSALSALLTSPSSKLQSQLSPSKSSLIATSSSSSSSTTTTTAAAPTPTPLTIVIQPPLATTISTASQIPPPLVPATAALPPAVH
jgi:hypothetical protein